MDLCIFNLLENDLKGGIIFYNHILVNRQKIKRNILKKFDRYKLIIHKNIFSLVI